MDDWPPCFHQSRRCTNHTKIIKPMKLDCTETKRGSPNAHHLAKSRSLPHDRFATCSPHQGHTYRVCSSLPTLECVVQLRGRCDEIIAHVFADGVLVGLRPEEL